MTISNKIIANTIFTIVLLGSAGVSGLAAKQLVTSYPEVKTIFNNDSAKVSEVMALNTNSNSGQKTPTNSNNSEKCIITVSGKKYDVLNLKKTHSGGDVFKCDTDMTNTFQSQHGSMYSLISKYLVTGSTGSTQTTNTNTGTSTNGATGNKITSATLATHNTSQSCWISYSGKVYNVTNNPSWTGCDHHGAKGGKDITSIFPHSTSYFSSLPLVGLLSGTTSVSNSNSGSSKSSDDSENENEIENEHNENENEKEDEWEFEFED